MFLKHIIKSIESKEVIDTTYLKYYKEYIFEYFETNELFCINLSSGESLVAFSEMSVIELVENYYGLNNCSAKEFNDLKKEVMNALLNVEVL